jgi:hypothetical protein
MIRGIGVDVRASVTMGVEVTTLFCPGHYYNHANGDQFYTNNTYDASKNNVLFMHKRNWTHKLICLSTSFLPLVVLLFSFPKEYIDKNKR